MRPTKNLREQIAVPRGRRLNAKQLREHVDASLTPVVASARPIRHALDAALPEVRDLPLNSLIRGGAAARLDEALKEVASASARIAKAIRADLSCRPAAPGPRRDAVASLARALEHAAVACGEPDEAAINSAERAARVLRAASNSPRLPARDEEGAENA